MCFQCLLSHGHSSPQQSGNPNYEAESCHGCISLSIVALSFLSGHRAFCLSFRIVTVLKREWRHIFSGTTKVLSRRNLVGGKHIAVYNRSSLKYIRRMIQAEGGTSTCRRYPAVAGSNF